MNQNLITLLIILLYFTPIFFLLVLVLKKRKSGNTVRLKRFLKFSKYYFLILTPLLIGFAVLTQVNYFNYEKPITFDKYEQITFENFRGLEFFKKSLYGNERFAYVVTTIEIKVDDHSVTVKSLFHPSRSFVYNNKTYSKELLKHEKYHIKITELFTRKGKERLSNLNSFDKGKIDVILNNMREEERAYQKEYDYNTFHSYVLSEQTRYEKEIDSLLAKLSKFKNPKIIINDKY